MTCQWNIFSLNVFLLKNLSSYKFRFLNMITVRFRLAHSFKNLARGEPVAVQAALPPVPVNVSALVEGAKTEFGLPVALTDESPKCMNFGILLRTELAKFIRLLGSKSVTISPGRLFTLILSVQNYVELRSWPGDPSTEVLNSSMFLDHSEKLY